jgi:hypothetical protein
VSILLGNGNGTFQAAVNYGAGLGPSSVAVGDFDGNSVLDLAIGNADANSISILLGNGDGTFQSAVSYDVGINPSAVAIGDFNADGAVDLAVANYDGNDISILLGSGDGTFQPAVDYAAGRGCSAVTIGDFNGDGRPDLAVTNFWDASVSILFGNGDGTFHHGADYLFGNEATSIGHGDFNLDGILDVAVATAGDVVEILLGNGDGTFQGTLRYGSGPYSAGLVVGDVNGDGKPDFAVANQYANTVGVYLDATSGPRPPVITASGPTTFCQGGSVTLDAGPGYATYLWSPGGESAETIVVSTSGSYSATVGDGSACTATSARVVVTVEPLPTPSITPSGPTTFCAGGSVTLDAGAGYIAYFWSPGGATTQTILVSAPGSYTVMVTDGTGCQGTSVPTVVTVNPAPSPVITTTRCVPANTSGLTASVPVVGGDTYAWTLTGGTIDSGQGTDTISFTSGAAATLMTISIAESNGTCSGSDATTMQVDFSDVPASNPFHTFICTIARNGITAGCGSGNYCPGSNVLRSQMAVFLLRGEHGSTYTPPPATGIFGDVLPSNPFAPWIEQLYNEGITGGCSTNPLLYCPNNPVSRAGMAVFLLVAQHGTGYVPPVCAGIFTDVACPSPFADWIEELYNEGITGGCGTNPLIYCPSNPVTRAQMAVFLTTTFNLQ